MATIGTISLVKGDIYTTAHKQSENRANDGYGILTGCDVHEQTPNAMGVTIDAGTVMYNGGYVTVAGGNLSIDAADATYPRFDIVYINGAGSVAIAKGTAAAILPTGETAFKKMTTPYPNPSVPAGIILARVYVAPAVSTITNSVIDDIAMQLTQVPLSVLTTRGDIPFRGANTWEKLAKGTAGQAIIQGANDPSWVTRTFDATFPFGDGSSVIVAGSQALRIPIGSKIIAARIRSFDSAGAPVSGSITCTLYKHALSAAIGSTVDTFTMSSATYYEETGLNISVTAGDWLTVITSSITTCTQILCSLTLEAT